MHSVCPEYTTDVLAAKKICDLAEKELPLIQELGSMMPGDFNMAASTLYGGYFHGLYVGKDTWSHEFADEQSGESIRRQKRFDGMTTPEAERLFVTAIAFAGTPELFHAKMKGIPKVVHAERRSMEVVRITLPSLKQKRQYAGAKNSLGEAGNFKPLGTLSVRHWDNPEAEEEDLTEKEKIAMNKAKKRGIDVRIEDFWLENDVLERCFIGLKFEATVRKLDIGLQYFDSIAGIYPSFFTFLPAQRLDGWREPIPNPRPAPTIHDDSADDLEDNNCD
jgi:hypothetical protein